MYANRNVRATVFGRPTRGSASAMVFFDGENAIFLVRQERVPDGAIKADRQDLPRTEWRTKVCGTIVLSDKY